MAQHNHLGRHGEDLAVKYLRRKGYRILARNWIFQRKELDIVAIENNQLVVVEVKSRSTDLFERPADAIDLRKIRRIVHATQAYIDMWGIDMEVRFDVISVVGSDDIPQIQHIVDAFSAPVD